MSRNCTFHQPKNPPPEPPKTTYPLKITISELEMKNLAAYPKNSISGQILDLAQQRLQPIHASIETSPWSITVFYAARS